MLVLVALLIVGLIGASPLALDGFQRTRTHWERLSFIGQTYGAASAVLSVFALIGVVTRLIFQAHETRLAREEAQRAAILIGLIAGAVAVAALPILNGMFARHRRRPE